MKIFKFKKTWASLAMVLLLAVFAMLNKPTLAASSPPAQITVGQTTYTANWVDRSHVKIDATNKSTGKTISSVLTDGAWDSNWEYTVSDPPSWSTCGSMKMNGFGSAIVGMTSRSGRGTWGSSDSYGNLTVQDGSCSNIIDNQQIKIGQWQNAGISFKATASDTIDVIDQGQSLTFSNPRLQSDGTVRYYLGGQLGDTCQEIIEVNFSNKSDPNFPISTMEFFEQKTDGSYASPVSSSCKLAYIAAHSQGMDDSDTISAYTYPLENFGTLQEPTSAQDGNGSGGSGSGGTGGSTSTSCESNFNSAFSWIVCPMLGFADSAIGFFYGQVENQLCFNTGASSTAGDFSCGKAKDTSLTDNVKSAWSIFKNIASALLVIVMLIMVISQAIGGGPFDAYTVRKMLPKLVAAVILMQLSWILLKFAIDLSNDLGAAIGNLMMAPFGGPSHMDLGSMLGKVVNIATGSQPGQVTFDVFASIAGVALFVWAIPALPLLAFYVFIGAFIAFFTLILRKLLIIMLVILAPLAFIAWLLPGTEKYWKLWTSNFSKLLIMFPMIMAMLSAGRIFAYITSTSGSAIMFNPHLAVAHVGFLPIPYIASATGFADIVIVIVAFFAPYFLLPKTYSWGGQLLGQAGKAVENYTTKGAEAPKKFLKQREEGYREERRRKSAARVSEQRRKGFAGVYFDKKKPWTLFSAPVDQFRAGHLDPTLGLPKSRRRGRNLAAFITKGEETSTEEAQNYGKVLDATLRGITGTGAKIDKLKESYRKTKNSAERYAILQRIAQFKDVMALQELRTETDASEWNSNLDSLYDTFKALDPEMIGGFFKTDAATGQRVMAVSHEVLAGMTSKGWVDFVAEAQREGRVGDAITAYQEIMQSEQANRVDEGAHAVMQGVGVARPAAHAPQAPAAVPGAAAPPGAPAGAPGPTAGGVLNVPHAQPGPGAVAGNAPVAHNTPTGRIISATDYDIQNDVLSRPGGWNGFSDNELIDIYNHRTGELKQQAAATLRSRGRMP